MKTVLPKSGIFTLVFLIFNLFLAGHAFGQTVTTDQPDYLPGTIVTINGSGFAPNEIVSLQVLHQDPALDNTTSPTNAHLPWTIMADANGDLSSTWLVPLDQDEIGASLIITADGQSSLSHADAFFTDSAFTSSTNGNWNNVDTWVAVARPGTITTSSGSSSVTGNSTALFLTNLAVGDKIYKSDFTTLIGTVASISSNTSLSLSANAASTNTTISYSAKKIPGSGDTVTIDTNNTITVNGTFSCASLVIGVGNGTATLTFSGLSPQLTVSGLVTLGNSVNANRDGVLTFTSGSTLIASSVINGNNGANGTITMTAGGTLKTGSFGPSTGTWTPGTGTVELTGTNALPSASITSFNNLIISSGTTTLGTAITINRNLTILSGATLDESSRTMTLPGGASIVVDGTLDFTSSSGLIQSGTSGTSLLTMGPTGTIRTVDVLGIGPLANASLVTQSGGSWTTTSISTNGTVEYYLNSAQALTDRDYNNLAITNTGTKTWTLGASRTINGNVTINSSAPFTLSGVQILNVKGNWSNSGTFTPGTGTLLFNGGTAQTIGGSVFTNFYNLSIAAGTSLNLSALNHTANTLSLGGAEAPSGTWGSTSSSPLAAHTNNTYFAATTGKVTVANGSCTNPSPPSLSANTYTYDGLAKTATATVGSGETIDWYAAATGTATANAPSGTNAGSYSAYAEARNSTTGCVSSTRTLITLIVSQRPITITVNSGQTKIYGELDPLPFTASVSSGVIQGTDAFSGLLVRASGENVGPYAISKGTYTYGSNYDETFVGANFSITAPILVVVTKAVDKATFVCAYANQTAADSAFATWLATASVSGGCTPSSIPSSLTAPLFSGGSKLVTWTITDGCSSVSTYSATFAITAITTVSLDIMPSPINTLISLSAKVLPVVSGINVSFYIDTILVGNSLTNSLGVATINNLPALAEEVYGVIAIAGDCTTSSPGFLPVYDPSKGFAVGNGSFDSPIGSYPAILSFAGKARFGFSVKYKKGTTLPQGELDFQLKKTKMKLESTSFQWLVIAGNKTQFKGTGKINGSGTYNFIVTAIDNGTCEMDDEHDGDGDDDHEHNNGYDRDYNHTGFYHRDGKKCTDRKCTTPDQFRIQITTTNGVTIYDNQMTMAKDGYAVSNISRGALEVNDIKKTVKLTSGSKVALKEEIIATSSNLYVYPNPTQYQFTLVLDGSSTEKVIVTVFDVLGRMVKHIEKNDGQPILFGEELPTGSYIAIISQGMNQKTIRLIKQ